MPDAARIAQAQALEIPVTVQGAKPADGTGRRELFSESAKTTLTFDNGTVLNLRTRVTPGQSLFLRNDQTGQEILCKVLEAPAESEPGYTDLEFMETAPGFWEGDPEEPQAAAEKPKTVAEKSETQIAAVQLEPATAKSEAEPAAPAELTATPYPADEKPAVPAHEGTEAAAAENSLAMMSATASELKLPPAQASDFDPPLPPAKAPEEEEIPEGRPREVLVPAHEMVPAAAPVAPATTEPTGEQIDAALRAMAAVPANAHDDAAESSEAKDKANLAALMAREARLAKYAALKEKAVATIGRGPASRDASKGAEGAEKAQGAEGAQGASDAIVEESGPLPLPLMERFTTGKNLIVSEIVVAAAIVVAFFFIWHAVSPLFIHPLEPRLAAATPARKAAPPKKSLPVVVQTAAAPVAKAPAARPTVVASAPRAPVAKIVRPPEVPRQSAPETVEEDGPRVVEPPPVIEEPKPAEPVAPAPPENIPAKIVVGSQPPLPPWAKNLDVATVVKLDAVIDEKGNLGETKIVSGPRLLERAAQQAVQLWIFEPAQTDGKPAASHMVLTVEFKR